MATIEQFTEVLKTQTELTSALLDVLQEQQQAIIHFQDASLAAAIERQQQLMKPIESLEKECVKIIHEFSRELHIDSLEPLRLSVLTNRLPAEEAARVNKCGKKLRSVIEKICTVNSQNKILLDNSLRFIKHNLRIMTDGYTKKLIDTTM
jgi:flagellar biosynthesis/type III secretory pathway chaperone